MKCYFWSIGFECFTCGERWEMHEDGERDLDLDIVVEILRECELLDEEQQLPSCPECGDPVCVWWTGVEDRCEVNPF